MTDADLDAIEARAKAASENWQARGARIVQGNGRIAELVADFGSAALSEVDCSFAAAARTDVPALIAEVRRLRAENEDKTNELSQHRHVLEPLLDRAIGQALDTAKRAELERLKKKHKWGKEAP